MSIWLALALGGALGTVARHLVNIAIARAMQPAPYATATVNIAGSFVVGALAGAIASGRLILPAPLRAFVFVGILGGFTTFSSFMLDTLTLAGTSMEAAFANLAGQLVVGVVVTVVGYRLFTS